MALRKSGIAILEPALLTNSLTLPHGLLRRCKVRRQGSDMYGFSARAVPSARCRLQDSHGVRAPGLSQHGRHPAGDGAVS